MRIAVLISAPRSTPEASDRLEGLAPTEVAALFHANALAEAGSRAQVVAVLAGPAEDARTLADATRGGASEAVRVWFDNSPRAGEHDLFLRSRLIAGALKTLGVDLTLAGSHSARWGRGVTGPAVAHVLGIPHLSEVNAVRWGTAPDLVCASQQRREHALTVTLRLPAVLTICASALAWLPDGPERAARYLEGRDLDVDPDDAFGPPHGDPHPAPRSVQMLDQDRDLLAQLRQLAAIR